MRWHENMPQTRREWWHGRGLDDATINRFFVGWDGKRYTNPNIQTKWHYFQLGWSLRGIK